MGGVDKTALEVAGISLLSRTVAAACAVCDGAVVVVGAPPADPATGRELADAGPIAGSTPPGAPPMGADAPPSLRSGPSIRPGVAVMREEPAAGYELAYAGPNAGSTPPGAPPMAADAPPSLRSGRSTASGVAVMREEPAGGGPVAAIIAALGRVDADEVLLLAGDLAEGDRAIAALVAAGDDDAAGADGVVLVDAAGRRQWLCARMRTRALVEAAARVTEPVGARMSDLFAGLRCRDLPDAAGVTADVDTWQDLSRARSRESGARMNDRTLPPEALDEWSSVLRDRFGLDAEQVPIAMVLDLARDVAHDVARPAAPLSAFVAGLVAGRAGGGAGDTAAAIEEVVALARAWAEGRAPGSGGGEV